MTESQVFSPESYVNAANGAELVFNNYFHIGPGHRAGFYHQQTLDVDSTDFGGEVSIVDDSGNYKVKAYGYRSTYLIGNQIITDSRNLRMTPKPIVFKVSEDDLNRKTFGVVNYGMHTALAAIAIQTLDIKNCQIVEFGSDNGILGVVALENGALQYTGYDLQKVNPKALKPYSNGEIISNTNVLNVNDIDLDTDTLIQNIGPHAIYGQHTHLKTLEKAISIYPNLKQIVIGGYSKYSDQYPTHLQYYKADDAIRILTENGFKLKRTILSPEIAGGEKGLHKEQYCAYILTKD